MSKKKNKNAKILKKQMKHLFSGKSFSGNMVSNILVALMMEWWEDHKEQRKQKLATGETKWANA